MAANPFQLLRDRLDAAGCRPKGTSARCPAHEDRNASLSFNKGAEERALVHCHAGCELHDVLAALNLTTSDLFPEPPPTPSVTRVDEPALEVAAYNYTDEHGQVLYQAVRYEPKDFRPRRPDGRGGWRIGLGDVRRVPTGCPSCARRSPAAAACSSSKARRTQTISPASG